MASTDQSTGAAVFSSMGVMINFCVFASEAPLMRKLIKEKDATQYSFWPAFTLLLACSLWSNYTVYVRPTVQLYLANFSGLFAGLVYLSIHAWFRAGTARQKVLGLLFGALFATCIFYGIAFSSMDFDSAAALCGTATVGVNCLFFIAPLKQLYTAVRELDTSRVPVTLSITQFIGASIWTTAGAMLGDKFILFPNAFGVAIASIQLGALGYVWLKRRSHPNSSINPHKQLDDDDDDKANKANDTENKEALPSFTGELNATTSASV